MSTASQEFCLFLDPQVATDLQVQTTPAGLRYVLLTGLEGLGCRDGILTRHENSGAGIQLESMRQRREKFLLMVAAPDARPTVNGIPVPHISTLNAGDVVTIDDHVLHVSLLNRPFVGAPEKAQIGAACGFCRLAIADEPDMRVYVCPNCQLPTHLHGDEVPAERRLQCATLSPECGHCQSPIIRRDGFAYVPDL